MARVIQAMSQQAEVRSLLPLADGASGRRSAV
jgi:hypothetical protein